jgi:hypothetical protein
LESLKVRDHSEDPGVGGMIILKWVSGKLNFGVWNGFIWLRIGKDQWQALVKTAMNFRFHKVQGIS